MEITKKIYYLLFVCVTDLISCLKYINADGGGRVRTKTVESDIWLVESELLDAPFFRYLNFFSCLRSTSQMLEAFSEASHPEWNDQLYLDPDVINGLALWLVDKQDPDTGAFQSVDDSYDIRMRVNRTKCGN